MKRILIYGFTIIFISAFTKSLFSQNIEKSPHTENQHIINNPAFKLSLIDSIGLINLPVLQTHKELLKTTLPDNLDNSSQPWFRELFEQESNECSQYAAIAFNFTYEIDYRRGISANTPENQYPTHYTFNFMNGGYGWHGVSYFHSYEIVRTNGHPNVLDYGGMAAGGPRRWLSGYNEYYNGMANKLENVYQINVGTPEGLLTLKNWLHNHLEGAEFGGISSYYASSPWNAHTLPPGTPEGGKYVMTNYIGNAGHSYTITGWNDSIRWDYNNDGQYTNDIDINGDGIVNMQDWEIGGLLFMDSYLGGLTWADSGYCYMMYKTLAEVPKTGGIWNHAVHIAKVKEDYTPLLTMKIKLKHTSREKIKVITGVSQNIEDEYPTYTLGFPIFDFQGGNQYMQGGNTIEENKTIEFGLDITPLLGEINNNQPAKFFLQLVEKDPDNEGSGEIIDFSVISYSNGIDEFQYPQSNTPILENATTTLGLETNFDFNQFHFTTNNLPGAITGELFEHQLVASGGAPPYNWKIIRHYEETSSTADFPSINGIQLNPTDTILGIAEQKIDFPFPFYGKNHDTLYIHTEGFIVFNSEALPWPYMYDENLMIRKTKTIAPFLSRNIYLNTSNNDGIWYEGDETYAAFRWKTTLLNPVASDIEFAVILYPSGEIEFYYGNEQMFVDNLWAAGISAGDDTNYEFADLMTKNKLPVNEKTEFIPEEFPDEMNLSDDGLFYGTPNQNYNGLNVEFLVSDYNNIRVRKTFIFNSWYEGIAERQNKLKTSLIIFPNPVNQFANIKFELFSDSHVSLNIYNIHGQNISTLTEKHMNKGRHTINWKVADNTVNKLPDGVYFCFLKTDDGITSTKMVIIK